MLLHACLIFHVSISIYTIGDVILNVKNGSYVLQASNVLKWLALLRCFNLLI